MTIGHYAPKLWAPGGIARYVRRVGRAQAEAGHRVCYVAGEGSPADFEDETVVVRDEKALFAWAKREELDVLHLHKPVRDLPADRVPTVRTMHGHQGSCPSATRYLARRGEPCDRRHGLAACARGRVLDGCGSRRPGRLLGAIGSVAHEHALAAELHTVTVSLYLRDEMVRAGCSGRRLHALLSPAPEAAAYEPPPREGRPRIAFLGRLVPQKGADWLLRAASRAAVPFTVDIAGDGPERDALETLARSLGLGDRAMFHGWLGDEDARAVVRGARAVAVPSVWHEPAGLVTLEAAAAGRAVVASRVGGIPEYAGTEGSLLVAPHDVDGLAQALDRVAGDARLAETMGRAALARARRQFAPADFVRDLDAVYRLAVEEGGGASRTSARVPSLALVS